MDGRAVAWVGLLLGDNKEKCLHKWKVFLLKKISFPFFTWTVTTAVFCYDTWYTWAGVGIRRLGGLIYRLTLIICCGMNEIHVLLVLSVFSLPLTGWSRRQLWYGLSICLAKTTIQGGYLPGEWFQSFLFCFDIVGGPCKLQGTYEYWLYWVPCYQTTDVIQLSTGQLIP